MRGFPQRVLVGVLGTVILALLVPACPHPAPGPNGPGGAGGSAPAPTPPAPAVSCGAACDNAVAVCSKVVPQVCTDICNRIGHSYAVKLLAAKNCPDVTAAGK